MKVSGKTIKFHACMKFYGFAALILSYYTEYTFQGGVTVKHKNITAAILVLSAFAGLCACTPAIDNGLTRSPQEHISVPEASVSASETDAGVPDESSQPDTPAQAAPVTGFDESILNQANTMLASMSLEEKVGQMFLARCPEADAASEAAAYHV